VERSWSVRPYAPPSSTARIDLYLDANEGPATWVDIAALEERIGGSSARRYPSAADLERRIAASLGVGPERVIVTAGGDEAIDRVCRAYLEAGRELILPSPTFEMIGRYARLAGAEVVTPAWTGDRYPIADVLDAITPRTAVIAVVSPNNPTGAVASEVDLRRLSEAAPWAVLLVDLAYTEFAEVDLTPAALNLPNAIIIRTFSKAFGLAGLRVGYAAGDEELIAPLRATGSPFPVSAWSLAVAEEALTSAPRHLPRVVSQVRDERRRLAHVLRAGGAVLRGDGKGGQANFVLADVADPVELTRRLAARGIGIRRFPGHAALDRAVRITCPGDEAAFSRLLIALTESPASLEPAATNSERSA
jgi:histidinol-phosphate aminotransferase